MVIVYVIFLLNSKKGVFMKVSKFAKMNGVSQRTVWNWINSGKIKIERTPTGGVNILSEHKERPNLVAIYARVSSSENKSNLEAQAQRLLSYANAKGYQVESVVKECGSGLNDQRPKLEKLLLDESIRTIIVEHKDRLARLGLNYIIKLLELQGRKIEIVNNMESERDDLMADFVSIITSFCARLYGLRRNKRRTEKLIEKLQKVDDK